MWNLFHTTLRYYNKLGILYNVIDLKNSRFSIHVAYTMAKYGMSMCVLGMSEEFKQHNIGVNALWPKTGMYSVNHHYFSIFLYKLSS